MSSDDEFALDNPMLVRWEFASEERLEKRNALIQRLVEGVDAEERFFEAIAELAPTRVLEVGCGAGALAARLHAEVGAEVVAVDTSERMVELTRLRGVEAYVADVQQLPFPDGSFDCVCAGWVFYHVADRNRALAECARVLHAGGALVTATLADENMSDLWDFLGSPRERTLTFSAANGAEQLQRHFATVETREAHGTVVFPTAADMREFVAANMTRAHLAAVVPAELARPVLVRTYDSIFIARKS